LLKYLTIDQADHAWATDITYIPMRRGFVYLVAIIDWATRRVLAHRVSISMTADFCVEALEEAIAKYGTPEIFNTDQGSQPRLNWSSQHRLVAQSVAPHSRPRLAYAS
jgi:putative transposase